MCVCILLLCVCFFCGLLPLDKVVLGHGLARIMSAIYC